MTDGLAPETANVIRRRVPEAYLYNQARAVTLADYVARALEVPGVSNAAAFYMWTGSWRTVRVVIDPEGTTTLSEPLARRCRTATGRCAPDRRRRRSARARSLCR